MARARGKPTAPVKRQPKDERSSVHGPRPPAAGTRKRAAAKPTTARKPAAPPAPPAPAAPRSPPARIPRSTKRSALPAALTEDAVDLRKRPLGGGATGGAPERALAKPQKRGGRGRPAERAAGSHFGGHLPAPRIAIEADASGGELRPSARADREPDAGGRVMELNWGDDVPSSRRSEGLVQRWMKRGDALLRHLAEHGAARHEYRANLTDGRFVWVDADGRVSAEAQAQVLCSWSRTTSALAMAWADPLVRRVGIARVDGMDAERDDIDEETAWRIAMEAADCARADYLYRVITPHAWYFLALGSLTFHPEHASFSPGTPVGVVLLGLAEARRAVESRAEPAQVVRDRIEGLGQALLVEAEYAYRRTSWVARLEDTGRHLVDLAGQLPQRRSVVVRNGGDVHPPGRGGSEWLDRQETIDLSDALALLEDEWTLLA
jgi:hypothetical protein